LYQPSGVLKESSSTICTIWITDLSGGWSNHYPSKMGVFLLLHVKVLTSLLTLTKLTG